MWSNFRVLAALEIGESSRNTVLACQSAKRTFAALIELFAPLAPAAEPAPARAGPPQRIAPALLVAYATDDPDVHPPGAAGRRRTSTSTSTKPKATRCWKSRWKNSRRSANSTRTTATRCGMPL